MILSARNHPQKTVILVAKIRVEMRGIKLLGALKPIGSKENIDLNTVYGPFLGFVSSSTNLPNSETNGVVIAIDPAPNNHERAVQFFVRDDCVYFRIRWQDWSQSGSPIIWQSWHKLWPQT